jgi:hypothetical protein
MEDGMEKPRHKHIDCPGCQFLGGMPCEEKWIDMYCCGDVIVLRWGDWQEEGLGGNSVGLCSIDCLSGTILFLLTRNASANATITSANKIITIQVQRCTERRDVGSNS